MAKQKTLELFDKGYNCCQSVFCAYGENYGLTHEQCFKNAAAFGGGIGGSTQHLCGVVNGALMAIGHHFAHVGYDPQTKGAMNKTIRDFLDTLKQNHKSLICKDILTEDHRHNSMHSDKCKDFVEEACGVLDEVLS